MHGSESRNRTFRNNLDAVRISAPVAIGSIRLLLRFNGVHGIKAALGGHYPLYRKTR